MESSFETNLRRFEEHLRDLENPEQKCFLCGHSLLDRSSSQEHVVPVWAQNRYDLWHQRMYLANDSMIQYRHLTVPCCTECNKYRLKPLEDSLSQTVEHGREAVQALGPKVLYLWLGKVFYGLLYKELCLLFDRRNPTKGTILTTEFVRRFETHRFFLQQARHMVETVDFEAGSVFVFDAQPLPEKRLEWDLIDNVEQQFIGCRVGRVALFSVLNDGGLQQPYEDSYSDIKSISLHPFQFRELCAHFSYRSTIANRTPKRLIGQGNPHKVFQLPLGGMSAKPVFDPWIERDYAVHLAHYMNAEFDQVFVPPDKVVTWLHGPDGKVRSMPYSEYPELPARFEG